MTNQPLTAEGIALPLMEKMETRGIHISQLIEALEAYAAQQNAELVAENFQLAACDMIAEIKAENERLKLDIEALEKENRECRAGLDRDICLNILRNERTLYQNERDDALAENERLKQQLAWQPISEIKEAGSYTFGMTVKFAAANDYTAFRSFNLEYTEEGDLMQEGDYFDEYELSDFQYFRPFNEPQPPKEAT